MQDVSSRVPMPVRFKILARQIQDADDAALLGSDGHTNSADAETALKNSGPAKDQSSAQAMWGPDEVGHGEYARVYRAQEEVPLDGAAMLVRPVVAKIFRDDAPNDLMLVYQKEREILHGLASHENIVTLRGAQILPPSFICSTCGGVFFCRKCPTCKDDAAVLENFNGKLRCKKDHSHVFQNGVEEDLKKLGKDRPCGHEAGLEAINFLTRPCILLDEMHVNVREFVDLLRGTKDSIRGHKLITKASSSEAPNDWKREAFLVSLGVLSKVAEALAFLHGKKQVHGDIAPENVMMLLSPTSNDGPQSISTRLVDFGQARPVSDPNVTGVVRGRAAFMAPERESVNNQIGPVHLVADGDDFSTAKTCTLYASAGVGQILSPLDLVRDSFGGEYIVKKKLSESGEEKGGLARLGEVQCQLELRTPPKKIAKKKQALGMQIWVNSAILAPADIYSLGCLILWVVTHGRYDVVKTVSSHADLATSRKLSVKETLAELRRDHQAVFEALQLPRTNVKGIRPEEEVQEVEEPATETQEPMSDDPEAIHEAWILNRLLKIVVACLVRGEGAYCKTRSEDSNKAALAAMYELREVYEHLLFLHRTRTQLLAWGKEQQSELERHLVEQERLRSLVAQEYSKSSELEALVAQARSEVERLKKRYFDEIESSERIFSVENARSLQRVIVEQQANYDEAKRRIEAESKSEIERLKNWYQGRVDRINSKIWLLRSISIGLALLSGGGLGVLLWLYLSRISK